MCFSEFDARLVLPMRLVRAWLLVTALALGLTACTTTNRADSNAEGEWRRAEGGFHAKLIVTDQYEALTRDWDVRAEEGKYPDASSIDHVLKGQPVGRVTGLRRADICLLGKFGFLFGVVKAAVVKIFVGHGFALEQRFGTDQRPCSPSGNIHFRSYQGGNDRDGRRCNWD